MASSNNPGSTRTYSRLSNSRSIPSTNAGIVTLTVVTQISYTPFLLLRLFSHLRMLPWVSNGYIASDPKFAEFTECDASKDIEPKAASHSSSVTQQNLIDFRSLYDIPRDHELIRPLLPGKG